MQSMAVISRHELFTIWASEILKSIKSELVYCDRPTTHFISLT